MNVVYVVSIEKDTHKRGKFMVVLRDSQAKLVGIPLRGATYDQAVEFEPSIRFAFEYGVNAGLEETRRIRATVKREPLGEQLLETAAKLRK